ncbi:MAG: hypothetical protein ACHP93_05630 [Solirubrobacterales bacterium]|nr:hypothetical protein [Thermoplasmata archaeon]
MDVDSVLVSVLERDKWRHRLELLEASLNETREQRLQLEKRLRRLKRELSKLGDYSQAILDAARTRTTSGTVHASHGPNLSAR